MCHMSAITVPIDVTAQWLLQAVQRMDDVTFNQFYRQIITIRAERLDTSLDTQERVLLETVANSHLPPVDQARLLLLAEKLETETIDLKEQTELAQLTNRSEQLNVERLTAVNELATLRRQPFHDLMQELGLLNQYA